MKTFKSAEMKMAYNNGGFRERYAMENGKKKIVYINGEKCYQFTYAENLEYQDGNGATYNTIRKNWIA